MTQSLPTITAYGQYKSGNYGAHSLRVSFPSGFTLWYSYETVIAFSSKYGRRVRRNDWSTTTGKHLNWIDEGAKDDRLSGAQFEALLRAELQARGLADIENGEHIHEWTTPKEGERDEETKHTETIFWCASCEASIDEDGGIIK